MSDPRVWEIEFSHDPGDSIGRSRRTNARVLVVAVTLQDALARFVAEAYDNVEVWSIHNRSGRGIKILEALSADPKETQ